MRYIPTFHQKFEFFLEYNRLPKEEKKFRKIETLDYVGDSFPLD